MKRKIIHIDQQRCNGCGLCANACQEGAIAMVDGKARLIRDDYCDGLGNCLPHCPTGAITFVEREAAPFDEEAVKAHMAAQSAPAHGCPGSAARSLNRPAAPTVLSEGPVLASQLRQWPVQIKLAPVNAPWLNGAHLLVAADCTAYAYGNFHQQFLKGRVCLIGCPKLDGVDYTEKLTRIIHENEVKSLTVVRMEVPCCGGLEHAAVTALKNSGKFLPWQVVTISIDGQILDPAR